MQEISLAKLSALKNDEGLAEPAPAQVLESTNARLIGVYVRDKSGQPVPGAQVKLRMEKWRDGWRMEDSTCYTTDTFGFAAVKCPVGQVGLTEIFASCDAVDLGGKLIRWEHPWEIAPTVTITLGRTVGFGGVVVDETGLPVAGAQVSFFRFMVDNIEQHRLPRGEDFDFPVQPLTTDGSGRWSVRGVPLALIDRIGFKVSHPEFIPNAYYCDLRTNLLEALLAGDFQTELRRGVPVRGVVRDETGAPVQDATAELDNAEVQTDAVGRFSFGNLRGGTRTLTVTARGYPIAQRDVAIAPDQGEIVIQLQRGNVIRGRVRDETGAALTDVVVFSEEINYYGRSASNYAARTDEAGQFHWDTAPALAPPLRFSYPGFVTLTNMALVPGADNVITLQKLADLEGTVLDDATDEPVKRFSVALRNRYTRDGYARPAKEFAGDQGRFRLPRDSNADEVRIASDEYEEHSGWLASDKRIGPLAYRLKRKASGWVQGVVVSPEGKPMPGVQVVRAGQEGREVTLVRGRFMSGAGSAIPTTDERGQFSLSPAHDSTVVYAVSSDGFGQISAEEIESGQPLVLLPFGRVKGTLLIGGQLAPRKWIQFQTRLLGLNLNLFDYAVRTDEDGDFTLDKLPPGSGVLLSFDQDSSRAFEDEFTAVQVKSGETTTITVRDSEFPNETK